jgi:hypothetical protein
MEAGALFSAPSKVLQKQDMLLQSRPGMREEEEED